MSETKEGTADVVRRVKLTLHAASSPVEIIYAGTFHLADRNRRLEIDEEMIDQMVTNFQRLEDEDRVNINVNHNSDAAVMEEAKAVGWLQAIYAERRDDRYSLMGIPRWTEEAAQAIDNEEFRFLSAEIDFNATDTLTSDSIGCRLTGLALTNIPAIPHLAPVHLSQMNMKARIAFATELLKEQSLGDKIQDIVGAFFRTNPDSNVECYWPIQIYDDYLIIVSQQASSEKLYKVTFTVTDEGYSFDKREEWVEVEQVFQPVTANTDREVPFTAAPSGTTEDAIMEESRLRELLGIGADISIEDAVGALRASSVELEAAKQEVEALKQQITATEETKVEEAETLTDTNDKIEKLSVRAEAFERQAAELKERVEKLTAEKTEREGADRVDLALRQGKLTKAELDAEEGFLRTMARKDPETFDRLMATRPVNTEMLTEQGSGQGTAPVTMDELFSLVRQELSEHPELSREQARANVFRARPELEALTRKEG